jgi:CheY-like chemotaxis protein
MVEKSHRILIVDDDADILANLSDILSDVGYETVTACSGPNALEMIDANCPQDNAGFDLCLLDFKMPGMNGVELLEKIHAKHPTIPAIMITAYAGDDGGERALDAGTWKVMRKPVDIKQLLGVIDEAVT